MKKLITVTVAAAALALTAGCGGAAQSPSSDSATAAAASAVAASPTSSAASTSSPGTHTASEFATGKVSDADFAALVRKQTTMLTALSDADLPIMGQTTCAVLANGGATQSSLVEQVIKSSSQPTFDITTGAGKDVGFLMGAATSNYCPNSTSALTALFPAS